MVLTLADQTSRRPLNKAAVCSLMAEEWPPSMSRLVLAVRLWTDADGGMKVTGRQVARRAVMYEPIGCRRLTFT